MESTIAATAQPAASLRWYLVQCRPHQDGRALEHLERQGFECYRPLYETERIRAGRKQQTKTSLFPNYLFIRLDCTQHNWLPIRSTRGVAQIVRFNDFPLPVPDTIIEQIRTRSQTLHESYLGPGEEVQITAGGFAGIHAIFLCNDGDQRVMLLINILNTEQTLSFPIRNIRKLRA